MHNFGSSEVTGVGKSCVYTTGPYTTRYCYGFPSCLSSRVTGALPAFTLVIYELIFHVLKSQHRASHGPVVKNPPASAGVVSLNPGLGRSHLLQGNSARAPQQKKPQQ